MSTAASLVVAIGGLAGAIAGVAEHPLAAASTWEPCEFPSARPAASWRSAFPGYGLPAKNLGSKPDPLPDACRKFEVPLNHAMLNGTTLTYHVARYSVRPELRRGAVWMLDGGPGGDAVDIMDFAPELRSAWEFYDILVPQHRGTGLSSPLECAAPLDVPACMAQLSSKFGDEWAGHFTTTEAVRDLSLAMAQVKAEEGGETHLYGLSYGTYMVNRFSQIAPGQADTLILDGICPSNQVRYIDYDENVDTVTSQLLYQCQEDSFCAEQFGARPVAATMQRAIGDYRHGRGACFAALGTSFPFEVLAQAGLLVAQISGNVGEPHSEQGTLLPAMLLRLGRCSVADIAALKVVLAYTAKTLDPTGTATTVNVLGQHIMMSELWVLPGQQAPAAEELLAETVAKDFASWGPSRMAEARPGWKLYTPDTYFGKPTTSDNAVLYLNGNADTATPLYWATYEFERAQAKDKKFIRVDGSLHVTLFRNECVRGILKDLFLSKSTAAIDTTRCGALLPKDFTASSGPAKLASRRLFGTDDAWGMHEDHIVFELAQLGSAIIV